MQIPGQEHEVRSRYLNRVTSFRILLHLGDVDIVLNFSSPIL